MTGPADACALAGEAEELMLPGLSCPMPVLKAKKALAKSLRERSCGSGAPIRTVFRISATSPDRQATSLLPSRKRRRTRGTGL